MSDIARLESGHTPSRKHPEYWAGDIPWIGIRDATGNHGRTLTDTAQHTNELGIANSSARLLPTNTVCLSRTASVGYVVVMGRPMATSQDFVNWVCSERIDFRFLKYVLLSEHETFLSFASGTTHQTIYFPEVKAFHVCLPPLDVQHRIVTILSAYDELIENNTRRIQILEEMAQAIYREWFVEFRYPGHENVPLVASDLGPIPEGWEASSWGRNATLEYGRGLRDYKDAVAEYRVFGTNGPIGWHDTPLFPAGVIVGRKGAYRGIHYSTQPCWIIDTAFFLNITQPDRLDPLLAYHQLRTVDLNSIDSGSAIPSTTREAFNAIGLVLPPAELCRRFVNFARDVMDFQRVLARAVENLRATRDLLLPRLISGEIDVSDLDIHAGDAAA